MMLNINYQIILLTLCFNTKAGEISVEPKCTATGYRLYGSCRMRTVTDNEWNNFRRPKFSLPKFSV